VPGRCANTRPAITNIQPEKQHVYDKKKRIIATMSQQPPTRLAQRIRAARQKLNLSQSQAATAWGISKRTLQEWEQGRREPRGLALAALEGIISGKPKRKTR
jgi:DNA-binding transcriptional regulator YiaG